MANDGVLRINTVNSGECKGVTLCPMSSYIMSEVNDVYALDGAQQVETLEEAIKCEGEHLSSLFSCIGRPYNFAETVSQASTASSNIRQYVDKLGELKDYLVARGMKSFPKK